MEALTKKYIDRVDVLLGKFPDVKASWYSHSMGGGFRNTVGYNALITECYQLLKNVHRSNHPDVQRTVHAINGESLHDLEVIEGIFSGLRNNLQNGLLDSLERQISIDIKADFLEAARSLVNEDQKDPAAVLASVVLEDTLKRLAKKHGIDEAGGWEMSVVAQSLLSKGVIEKSTNQSISSFKNLRNAALHAQWSEASKESVTLLLGGERTPGHNGRLPLARALRLCQPKGSRDIREMSRPAQGSVVRSEKRRDVEMQMVRSFCRSVLPVSDYCEATGTGVRL